ncbi:MAG: DUF4013 domain-containing protein [Anaerolineales bacterium]
MDIGKSFSFPFEDNQWVSKLGLGAVISMVPFLHFAWLGYIVELIRNVMNGAAQPLPNWDDIGKKFMDGLILTVAGLVYALPMLLVICLPMGFMVIPAILSGNRDLEGLSNAIASAGGVLFTCLLCVFVIYALVLSVIYPAILIVFAREGTLASCFKFREVFDLISKNMTPFLTAWGVSVAAGFVINLVVGTVAGVLSIIPCLGWILAVVLPVVSVVYISASCAHLFGQFGQSALGQAQSIVPSQAS